MRLLGRADSLNVRKVLWAMDELGVTFKREDYGGQFGKVATPEYRALNPHGLVPTLIDEENVVWESNTIIRYLGDRAQTKDFVGCDPVSRAHVSQWMDWQLGMLNPPLQTLFFQLMKAGEDKRSRPIVDECIGTINRLLDALAGVLQSNGFLLGNTMSGADVCIGVMLHRYTSLLGTDSLNATVAQYFGRLAEREGYRVHVSTGQP